MQATNANPLYRAWNNAGADVSGMTDNYKAMKAQMTFASAIQVCSPSPLSPCDLARPSCCPCPCPCYCSRGLLFSHPRVGLTFDPYKHNPFPNIEFFCRGVWNCHHRTCVYHFQTGEPQTSFHASNSQVLSQPKVLTALQVTCEHSDPSHVSLQALLPSSREHLTRPQQIA